MEEKLKKKIDRLKVVKLILIIIVIMETLMITGMVTYGIVDRIEFQRKTRGMEDEKADAYNQKFQFYIGSNVKGTSVKNLYDVVRNHNIQNEEIENLLVSINGKNTPFDLNAEKAKIIQSKMYNVKVPNDGYDPDTGYITKIEVKDITKEN